MQDETTWSGRKRCSGQIGEAVFTGQYRFGQFFKVHLIEQSEDFLLHRNPFEVQRARCRVGTLLQAQNAALGEVRPFGQQQNLHQCRAMHAIAQAEATQAAAKGIEQTVLAQILQDFGQIGGRNIQPSGDVAVEHGLADRLRGNVDQRLNGILAGAG